MYTDLMKDKELNVKAGDKVRVQGYTGIVTEVIRGYKTKWNGTDFVNDREYLDVRVNFDNDYLKTTSYNNRVYGGFEVIK